MTKREFLKLKAARPLAEWTESECLYADKLIRDTTIKNLKEYLRTRKVDNPLRKWILQFVGHNFYYAETGEMLVKLKVYPDWGKNETEKEDK